MGEIKILNIKEGQTLIFRVMSKDNPSAYTGTSTIEINDNEQVNLNIIDKNIIIDDNKEDNKKTNTDPVILDKFLSTYNKKFFNASNLTYPLYEPIKENTEVYELLQYATNYYNEQFDLIDWDYIFEDQMEVNQGYEITNIGLDKEAGFGWFLAFLLTSLYPFTKVGDSKTRNSRIFEIAFTDYSEVYKGCDYSKFDTKGEKGTIFLRKLAGTLAASIIFARMMGVNEFRTKFKALKNIKYTSKCMQEYYYCDAEKFLYEDMYTPKAEDFFPLPPANNGKNWVIDRDMRYHDIGGQLRNVTSTGKIALNDRSAKLNYYLNIFGELDYSNNIFKTINKPSSVSKNASYFMPGSGDWHRAINDNHLGFSKQYLGYARKSYQKYCLLDLSRKVGNRVAQRIKAKGDPGEPFNRPRPLAFLSNEKSSSSYPNGGYYNNTYYYDNIGSGDIEITANLKSTTSYPSGHTGCGWNMAFAYCLAFKEFSDNKNIKDFEKLFRRAYQYCESRVIVGAHWQQCVDLGRIAAACGFAMVCANKYFIEQIDNAQAE